MLIVNEKNFAKNWKSQFATSKLVSICDPFNILNRSKSQNAILKVGDKLSHPFRENKTKFLTSTIRNFRIVQKMFENATIKKNLIVQNV